MDGESHGSSGDTSTAARLSLEEETRVHRSSHPELEILLDDSRCRQPQREWVRQRDWVRGARRAVVMLDGAGLDGRHICVPEWEDTLAGTQ